MELRERLWIGERCPYCRDPITEGVLERARCPSCKTPHHTRCLEELGSCTILGCQQPFERSAPAPEPEQDPDAEMLVACLKRNYRRHAAQLQSSVVLLEELRELPPAPVRVRVRPSVRPSVPRTRINRHLRDAIAVALSVATALMVAIVYVVITS